jgi:hypothetical protein
MKYTKEITDRLVAKYRQGATPEDLSRELGVPVRSIIAKLSSLGVYQRKQYLNKRGEVPVKKSELILELSKHLDLPLELLESLEKVNKIVLESIIRRITDPKSQ